MPQLEHYWYLKGMLRSVCSVCVWDKEDESEWTRFQFTAAQVVTG